MGLQKRLFRRGETAILQIHLLTKSSSCFGVANLTVLTLFFSPFDPSRPAAKTLISLETVAHFIHPARRGPQGPPTSQKYCVFTVKVGLRGQKQGQNCRFARAPENAPKRPNWRPTPRPLDPLTHRPLDPPAPRPPGPSTPPSKARRNARERLN